MTEQPPILVEHVDTVSTITFNRPAQLNALDPDMVEEFQSIVRRVDLEPSTRAIVLTGAGRAFTAGGDVRSFGSKHDPRVNRRGWSGFHALALGEAVSIG